MVRHHVEGKKKNKMKPEFQKQTFMLDDLDRFAGSSGDEGPDTDNESLHSNENEQMDTLDGEEADESSLDAEEDSSSEDEYGPSAHHSGLAKKKPVMNSNSEEDSEDDILINENEQSGMAGAMARILGFSAPTTKQLKAVVLSKTITPLQKQQRKEKEQQDALRLKRKHRREVNLNALHIPLSVAVSRPVPGKGKSSNNIAKAMTKDIELESMHRRVATRGVVALFNTIAQHQQQRALQQTDSRSKEDNRLKTMSKHGFLDMLKKTGPTKIKPASDKFESPQKSQSKNGNKSGSGWNALKDDFMMNAKLKDWDKTLSEDESGDDGNGLKVKDSGDEDRGGGNKPKKRKIS